MSKAAADFVTPPPAEKLQNFFGVFLQFQIGVDNENVNNDEYDAGIEWLEWAEPILILNACYYDLNAPGDTDEYAAAVADAAATVDADERIAKIGEIQKAMFENWNMIPFYSEATYIAYNDSVKASGLSMEACIGTT